MRLNDDDFVDKANVSHVFFYGNTILLVLNKNTYGDNHWISMTAKSVSNQKVWQGPLTWEWHTSIQDTDLLKKGVNSSFLPPNISKK